MLSKPLNLEGMKRRLEALGEKFPDLEEKRTFNLSLERPFIHLTSRYAEPRSVIMAINRDGTPCLTAGDFAEANDERVAVVAPNAVFVPAMQVLSVFRRLHPESFEKLVEVTNMLCTPSTLVATRIQEYEGTKSE